MRFRFYLSIITRLFHHCHHLQLHIKFMVNIIKAINITTTLTVTKVMNHLHLITHILLIMKFLEKPEVLKTHIITILTRPAITTINKIREVLQVIIFRGTWNIYQWFVVIRKSNFPPLFVTISAKSLLNVSPEHILKIIQIITLFLRPFRSLNNQNGSSGSYLLGTKTPSITAGNVEASIPPTSSAEHHPGVAGLSGSSTSPSLLSSSANQLGLGPAGLLNESTSAIEGKSFQ